MRVRFLDVGQLNAAVGNELRSAFDGVLASGQFVLGPEVEAFERDFAAYCGVAHCVGVANGLDAIELMLRAAGIGPGDDVLVPSNTFIATWFGVTRAGARPVPVEPRDESFNMNPSDLARALTPRTRAVMPVHLYGQPADMGAIGEFAAERGLVLFEDAAQAHGAAWDGRRVGGIGQAAAFSFYPGKNLGALGDAGAVLTGDARLAERVRSLRNYGSVRKYHHDEMGQNSRLDPLQAAFLRVKLPLLDEANERRRRVAARYDHGLEGLDGLIRPREGERCRHVWHLYVVRHPRRDALREALAGRGVETLIHYPIPPHLSAPYARPGCRPLPVAESHAATVLSLPMGPHLGDTDVEVVIEAVRESVREVGG